MTLAKLYQGFVMQVTRRNGFSLIEALVVLAIGGMALAVIFSIGIKAGDTGFALGRRAMSAADADVATSDFRNLIRSLELRPGSFFMVDVDRPINGQPKRLEGPSTLLQASLCAPQGWAGQLALVIESSPEGQVLNCYAGDRVTPLFQWSKGEEPTFSYSQDGLAWTPTYQSPTQARLEMDFAPEEIVWIRLHAPPSLDIVERLSSGRSENWSRPDVLQ